MDRRTRHRCQPCKRSLFPALLATVGLLLLLCCLPFWAFLAMLGVFLIVLACWLRW